MDYIFGPILLWIPIVIVVLAIWWFSTHRSVTVKAIHVNGHAPAKPSEPAHHKDHKEDDHGHGGHGHGHNETPAWIHLLGWCVAIAVIALIVLFLRWCYVTYGLGQIPGPSREVREEISRRNGSHGISEVPPSDARTCSSDPAYKVVIQPGTRITVHIPRDTTIDFKPDTSEGNITACSFRNPEICSSSLRRIKGHIDYLTITNVSESPVDFTCRYL